MFKHDIWYQQNIPNMKTCKKCNIEKNEECFGINKTKLGGRNHSCKDCLNAEQRELRARTRNSSTTKYEKTKPGFLMRLYRNMKSRITGVQKHNLNLYIGKELLPKEEFYKWAFENKDFHRLWRVWVRSEYERRLCPGVDRIDSSRGYTLDNMQFVTLSVNCSRSSITKKLKKEMAFV